MCEEIKSAVILAKLLIKGQKKKVDLADFTYESFLGS